MNLYGHYNDIPDEKLQVCKISANRQHNMAEPEWVAKHADSASMRMIRRAMRFELNRESFRRTIKRIQAEVA